MTGLQVAVTGSTGLLGEALVSHLRDEGHDVRRVVRSREAATGGDIYWSPSAEEIDGEAFEGLDAVVHLAASPLGPRVWTERVKREIMASRSQGTGLLATTLTQLSDPPRVLVSQSGINWYGYDRGDEWLDEESAGPGDGFLAKVCEVWEDSTGPAVEDDRIRVCITRTSPVLASDGGFLPLMALPFKLGLGGPLGSGEQWMSWISLEDDVRAMTFLVEHDDVEGVVNVTAPNPVTNAEFSQALAEALHRPSWLRVPRILPPGNTGELLRETAFFNLRVAPRVLEEHGFEFRHRDLRSGLASVL